MRPALAVALVLISACSSLYDYTSDAYVVRSGDTLYSIAFRHGLNPAELAAWNGLANPDRIYVGQRLTLAPAAGRVATARPAAAAPRPTRSQPAASVLPGWRWPAEGRVVGRFGDRRVLGTGIGIAGTAGQDVNAAAAGRVVYAGSGLPDYGQLVIIEHAGNWLSAYGLNRRMLVEQGDIVGAGTRIAEMGSGPDGTPLLHFEVRRNGDPLDPLTLLPPLP